MSAFRKIPLYAESEDQQIERIENEVENIRLRYAIRMGNQAIKRVQNKSLVAVEKCISEFLKTEQVQHTLISLVTSMVLEEVTHGIAV